VLCVKKVDNKYIVNFMSAYASSITLLSATTMKEIGSCDLWNQITQSTDDVGQDDPYTQKQKWCLVRGVEKK